MEKWECRKGEERERGNGEGRSVAIDHREKRRRMKIHEEVIEYSNRWIR